VTAWEDDTSPFRVRATGKSASVDDPLVLHHLVAAAPAARAAALIVICSNGGPDAGRPGRQLCRTGI